MHFAVIARVLGVLLMMFSLILLTPVSVSLWFNDHNYMTFLVAFAVTFSCGLAIWAPVYKSRADLRTRDGFLITALFWFVLGAFGAVPLFFSNGLDLSVTDAIFESISGLTTTGATVITGLDTLPPSILFYRQQLQWFGGIGIIVIAVAILPMLGIGGMQLYRAEAPGPVKDNKLTPRITETAKALFTMYLVFTLACAISYRLAGMNWFEAICHAFSTIANGGFSTHDASILHYQSPAIMMVCTVFMLIAGINFALHFFVWREKSLRHYFADAELKFFLYWIVVGCVVTVAYLAGSKSYTFNESFFLGIFNFVSTMTTAGFASNYSSFPSFLPYMLFIFAFVGGCASSTGGGMKAIRVLLLYKQGVREIHRLIHPNAVIAVKVGNITVPDRVIEAVWGFFAMYVVAFAAMFLLLIATGLDLQTAFSAVGACITNLGPGMGQVASHYSDINSPAKWVLCFAMLLGRLEVFTLLVLFSPVFWRR
ncbi:TrkH family potassium uptake protein [Gilvimarinus agarilyticus]|uniref:TrkH family potassium uptake protein n=1 Tax=unclassified Gilvimarinus TaxID=2642066 RepID=UPI001C09A57A|nr:MULTISPECIES: TrkH family potassium uptake protein [unclassified Gilvimarinus]MBU2884239.1 TrkH family potassium uptake protein [Gilvimarinus agarilyticus]MDO6569378.1 TrkH family potassium uptake protein [Gilvimarinus sp. 2_MG-2023]MDO6747532.1 TrkH family potassium uptake protein [Gilvimarinus sp. 1_MG-2023]